LKGSHEGTWVHPVLAVKLVDWACSEFAYIAATWTVGILHGDFASVLPDVRNNHDRLNKTSTTIYLTSKPAIVEESHTDDETTAPDTPLGNNKKRTLNEEEETPTKHQKQQTQDEDPIASMRNMMTEILQNQFNIQNSRIQDQLEKGRSEIHFLQEKMVMEAIRIRDEQQRFERQMEEKEERLREELQRQMNEQRALEERLREEMQQHRASWERMMNEKEESLREEMQRQMNEQRASEERLREQFMRAREEPVPIPPNHQIQSDYKNLMRQFLTSEPRLQLDPLNYMPATQLLTDFNHYCLTLSTDLTAPKNIDYYKEIFQEFNISVKRDVRKYYPRDSRERHKYVWLIGIDVAASSRNENSTDDEEQSDDDDE
jgi:hypothetical protein